MRLYSPVDLTGNVNLIETLVLGGTGTGDLLTPEVWNILSPCRHVLEYTSLGWIQNSGWTNLCAKHTVSY